MVSKKDNDILRDGESFRVPMTMMDAQQRAAAADVGEGAYGALGGTHAYNWIQQPDPGEASYKANTGGDPDGAGTKELPHKKDPERTPRDDYMVQLREAWKNPLETSKFLSEGEVKFK